MARASGLWGVFSAVCRECYDVETMCYQQGEGFFIVCRRRPRGPLVLVAYSAADGEAALRVLALEDTPEALEDAERIQAVLGGCTG